MAGYNKESVGNTNAFASVCRRTFKVDDILVVARLQAPATQIVDVYENGHVVTGEVESFPGFTSAHDSFLHGAERFFEGTLSARSTSLKRELSSPDVDIGPVNGKIRVLALLATVTPLIANEKV